MENREGWTRKLSCYGKCSSAMLERLGLRAGIRRLGVGQEAMT